jgi:hypothetical protein
MTIRKELARLLILNSCLSRGLPDPQTEQEDPKQTQPTKTQTTIQPPSNNYLKSLAIGSIPLVGVGLMYLGSILPFGAKKAVTSEPQATVSAITEPIPVITPDHSLLQDLEDGGYHIW